MMKPTMISLAIPLLIALAAIPVCAQQNRFTPIDQSRLQRVMDPNTNVEEFRQEYAAYLAEMDEVVGRLLETGYARQIIERSGLDPKGQLSAARQKIQELNEQELIGLKNAFAQSPSWREMPRKVDAMLSSKVQNMLRNLSSPAGDNLPGGTTPDVCDNAFSDAPTDKVPRSSNSDVSIATAAVLAANAVADSLPDDFLSVAGKVVAVVARTAVEAVLLTLETLKNISDDCSGRDFENEVAGSFTTTNNNINTRASQSSVNALQSTADTIDANVKSLQQTAGETKAGVDELNRKVDVKVSTRSTMAQVNTLQGTANTINTKTDMVLTRLDEIEAVIKAFQAENLRLQIELNLLQGPRYNLAQFQTPASAGGRLELVRSIVDDTIKKGAQAGVPQSVINQANNEMVVADAHYAATAYKDAYAHFRTAYLLIATNPAMRQP